MALAVELKNITKKFPGVVANKDVSLDIEWATVHGLVGENGAGKTTLMKILYGMHPADEGEIFINGERVAFHSPKDAIAKGIGMVHQHFTLVPSLTVAQNIILGRPICKKNGFLDIPLANKTVEELGKEYGLRVDPKATIKDLPVAMRQRVEILKALYLGADILILDEPTAVLIPQEIEQLLKTLILLKEKGKCIILITHKLKELMNATDHITVLRNGIVTGGAKTNEVNEKKIAAMMVGREIEFEVPKGKPSPADVALEAENLTYKDKYGVLALNNISFNVRRGEIVGIAGVQGNGQTELIQVLSGMSNNYIGKIKICDNLVNSTTPPLVRRQYGLAHIPEDRQITGAALGASLIENFIMGGLDDKKYTSCGLVHYKKASEVAKRQFKLFDVRFAGMENTAGSLSGGNLQKAIVSREIYRNPQILIAAQPSRGVDIGATMFIHEKLIEMRDSGKAVLLVSSELSEIMSLSDRILVMYKGMIMGETTPQESTEEDIGLLMAGIKKEEHCI